MEHPTPRDLGHDLRNLLGLVRAVTFELDALVAADARTAWKDLDRCTQFAMDALRVLERWEDTTRCNVHLGALMWAARLCVREMILGEVANVGRVELIVPDALAAVADLARAMGSAVSVEPSGDGVELVSRERVDAGIAAAAATVRRAGLDVLVRTSSVWIAPMRG